MEYPSDVEITLALRKRIKELEDGACRFNCRTAKDAFIAGAHAVLPPIDDGEVEFIERKYREWRNDDITDEKKIIQKEAFIAGYKADLQHDEITDEHAERAYQEWKDG